MAQRPCPSCLREGGTLPKLGPAPASFHPPIPPPHPPPCAAHCLLPSACCPLPPLLQPTLCPGSCAILPSGHPRAKYLRNVLIIRHQPGRPAVHSSRKCSQDLRPHRPPHHHPPLPPAPVGAGARRFPPQVGPQGPQGPAGHVGRGVSPRSGSGSRPPALSQGQSQSGGGRSCRTSRRDGDRRGWSRCGWCRSPAQGAHTCPV